MRRSHSQILVRLSSLLCTTSNYQNPAPAGRDDVTGVNTLLYCSVSQLEENLSYPPVPNMATLGHQQCREQRVRSSVQLQPWSVVVRHSVVRRATGRDVRREPPAGPSSKRMQYWLFYIMIKPIIIDNMCAPHSPSRTYQLWSAALTLVVHICVLHYVYSKFQQISHNE